MPTGKQLVTAAKEFNTAHGEWASDDRRPLTPDAPYLDAMNHLLATCAEMDSIPGEVRGLHAAVEELDRHADKVHKDDRQFWSASERIEHELKQMERPLPKPMESVIELILGEVPLSQIAVMFRLVDEHGNGRSDLILRELCDPGSILTDDWVDPRLADHPSVTSEQLEAIGRQKQMAKEPPGDSAESLFFAGQTVHNTAIKLGKSVDEIDRLFAGFRRKYGRQLFKAMVAAGVEDVVAIEKIESLGGLGLEPRSAEQKHEALAAVH